MKTRYCSLAWPACLRMSRCHTIVESMGGRIDVRSTPRCGTTFVVAEKDEKATGATT
jgi:K+-sensing histidine kinase KdpD